MEPTTQFLQQGLLGAIIVVLAGVVFYQNNKLESKNKEITEGFERRITDSQQYSTQYIATTKEMVGVNKDLTNQITVLQKSNESLVTMVQKLLERMGNKL